MWDDGPGPRARRVQRRALYTAEVGFSIKHLMALNAAANKCPRLRYFTSGASRPLGPRRRFRE
jgi:hypothetical protein